MEVMTSRDYREAGEQAEETLRLRGHALDHESKRGLKVGALRAENLKKIERATGLKFDVFRKGEPRVAAFITVAEQKTYMAEHSLDDLGWAMYAAKHELKHKQTKDFMRLGNEKITVFSDQYDALDEELRKGGIVMENVNWIEGFTDLLTARENGKHHHSGYSDHEVPAAEKLDRLCVEMTGASLAEAFNMNNVPLFTSRLRRLGEVLLMRKSFDELARRDGEIEGMRGDIELKMKTLQPIVPCREDAEKAVAKMIAEQVALKAVRRYVGLDENLPSIPTQGRMLS